MEYIIRYPDGKYNYGPIESNENGFPVTFNEATRYASLDIAKSKAIDLGAVQIIPVESTCYNYKCALHTDRMNPICNEKECSFTGYDNSLVGDVFAACDSIDNGRKLDDVMVHMMTEVGELAQEIIIAAGRSHKQPGKDGVVGEAIDVINCALDIIRLTEPNITEEQLRVICDPKLGKWKKYAYGWYKNKESKNG